MQQGLLARISRSSIMEYHAFGIISYASFFYLVAQHSLIGRFCREGTHAKYHYLICGVQGDFTRSLVNDPPTHVWTRQLKVSVAVPPYVCASSHWSFQFAGVSNTSTLYKRGIRVCTGTGLGAALSTCIQVRPLISS